jgi:hypothetical protein
MKLLHKIKIPHWEYWPQWLFYAPIFPYYLWCVLRTRNSYFGTAANPAIEYGGWEGESKHAVLKILDSNAYPATAFIKANSSEIQVQQAIAAAIVSFPAYVKPDLGGRGMGVARVHNQNEATRFLTNLGVDYLVQTACKNSQELGIFYVQYPDQSIGFITGIVQKKVLSIVGDGKHTVAQLIQQDIRTKRQANWILEQPHINAHEILPAKKELVLSSIGSHTRGSQFIDITDKCTPQLQHSVRQILAHVKGYSFGRLDVMCASVADALAGGPLEVIELNGAGAEPTHLYDPNNSVLKAYKIILMHWQYLYRCATINVASGSATFLSSAEIAEMKKKATVAAKATDFNLVINQTQVSK